MAHNPSELRMLLTEARTIAIVGASAKPDHPSHGVMQKLLFAGYHVVPINPRERSVLGRKSYGSLLFVPFYIDIVVVFGAPAEVAIVADQATAIGATALWLQQPASPDATARARASGLAIVVDPSIAATHQRLGVSRAEISEERIAL